MQPITSNNNVHTFQSEDWKERAFQRISHLEGRDLSDNLALMGIDVYSFAYYLFKKDSNESKKLFLRNELLQKLQPTFRDITNSSDATYFLDQNPQFTHLFFDGSSQNLAVGSLSLYKIFLIKNCPAKLVVRALSVLDDSYARLTLHSFSYRKLCLVFSACKSIQDWTEDTQREVLVRLYSMLGDKKVSFCAYMHLKDPAFRSPYAIQLNKRISETKNLTLLSPLCLLAHSHCPYIAKWVETTISKKWDVEAVIKRDVSNMTLEGQVAFCTENTRKNLLDKELLQHSSLVERTALLGKRSLCIKIINQIFACEGDIFVKKVSLVLASGKLTPMYNNYLSDDTAVRVYKVLEGLADSNSDLASEIERLSV